MFTSPSVDWMRCVSYRKQGKHSCSLCQTFCAGKTAVHRLAPKDIDKGAITRLFSLRRQGQLLANNDALSASSQALFAHASEHCSPPL